MAPKSLNFGSGLPSSAERYTLEYCVGQGAYAKVYMAIDTQASYKKVATKIQDFNDDNRKLLEQEYSVLRDLSANANLADFYGIYKNDDKIWFVMELCEGGTVRELVTGLIARNRRMAEEHIAYILKEVVKALIFLHENRIVHRDVKAKNILLTKEGEVKLVDFGSGCTLKSALDVTKGCIGSPCWMAPEVVNFEKGGSYGNRVDVWGLGITAIEMGDGEVPYASMHPSRVMFQIVANPPPSLSKPANWSVTFVDFINECLIKNPEHRPYMIEVIDHPFLEQIPENNYHLSLEIKSLINDVDKIDGIESKPEVALQDKFLKTGAEGTLVPIYVEDLALLTKITETNVMKELEARMKLSEFQTFIGDVLLSLNPNEKINIFGEDYHRKYQMKSRSDNAPHIYAIADSAYQNALHHLIPQKIVLSGESGSGKTTNYLHLINHLLFLGENQNINLSRLKGAIKLIHALTHASTPTNNYSTRCLFKTEIIFGTTGKITGAIYNVKMLEKWRISSVDMFQGNYHFFYYILNGLENANQLEQYHLEPNHNYRYLRLDSEQERVEHDFEKNCEKFQKILKILEDFDFSSDEIETILSITIAILLIGEIRVQETEDENAAIANEEQVEKVSELLKIDSKKLNWALTNYCVIRKGVATRKRSSVDEARDARDVLANTLYLRLVDYIVQVINQKLEIGRSLFGQKYFIQIFDYFGFECFKRNHLPQLLVNCFNEQLQYHYLQRLFSWECLDVNEEEIEYQTFKFYDNKATLDSLLGRSEGILSLIDEASKQGHSGKHVLELIQSQDKQRVTVMGSQEFSIAHYTGKVVYDVNEMPDKNRDFLPPEIVETMRLSENIIIKSMFCNKLDRTGNLVLNQETGIIRNRYRYQSNKAKTNEYSQLNKIRTSITTFKALSIDLLKELSIGSGAGGTHFVRCIRTDLKGQPGNFNQELIKHQIRALAVVETAKARQKGYPHRVPFQEFLRRYQFLAFDFNETVDINKENCRLLLIRLKMEDWAIGKTKVFLKYYNEEYLSRLYENQVRKIIKIQSILRRFLAKCLVEKQVREFGNEALLKVRRKSRIMSEEEAAAIIQRAYRESTIKKTYLDFAKDFKVLDEEECNFIRPFANKWRHNSLFHVLVQYRAAKFQEIFNFTQQVHLYNLGSFHELQVLDEDVELELLDENAQATSWLGETKIPVLKVPFHLEDIPFYDTTAMCDLPFNNPGNENKDEAWDTPYRWRELISSGTKNMENLKRKEEILIDVPFNRDPSAPVKTIPVVEEEEDIGVKSPVKVEPAKITKNLQNKEVKRKMDQSSINTYENQRNILNNVEDSNINCNAKLANKDFDYIKSPIVNKPKQADPVSELRRIARKASLGGEDDPPFNFQGMLRKTNFQKEQKVVIVESNIPKVPLKKTSKPGKRIATELLPGVFIEGIEVDL